MFEVLILIEKLLLSPPASYLTLGLLAYYLSKKIKSNYLFPIFLLTSYIISTPVFTNFLMTKIEGKYQEYKLVATSSPEAIIVLGSGLNYNAWEYGGISVSGRELERLRHTAKLHRDTKLPVLVAGGDPLNTGSKEASYMKKVLEDEFQIPVKWVEGRSRTTKENLEFANIILQKNNIKSAYLVTHSWHMQRAIKIANKNSQISYTPSACSSDISKDRKKIVFRIEDLLPSLKSIEELKIIIHEVGGEITNI